MPFGQSRGAVSLAPDGRHVAVVAIHRLFVVTPHTRRLLATDAGQGWSLVWTPDGRKLVYFDQANRLVVQDVATRSRRVIAGAGRLGAEISISPDGRTIYVAGVKPAVSIPK
jgi:Tol biopolymer transport system component